MPILEAPPNFQRTTSGLLLPLTVKLHPEITNGGPVPEAKIADLDARIDIPLDDIPKAAVLNNREILARMHAGDIVIQPFKLSQLQSSSYDLCLGDWYFEEQHPGNLRSNLLYNPFNPKHVERVWGKEPKRALPAREYQTQDTWPNPEDWIGIEPDDLVIVIGPSETILGHTFEFAGIRRIGTSMMKARSSVGRSFIEVCKCAGWGDIGYINRWTMEITNNSRFYQIPLVVGMRFAQLIFFYTGETDLPYHTTGVYQNTANLEELEANWDPTSMLPKLRK